MKFKVGAWKPDDTQPGSHDDYAFADLKPKLSLKEKAYGTSSIIDLRRFCSTVENQGQIGSCVGNSVVGALELLQASMGLPRRDLSRMFVYYNSRLMHQEQDRDDGTYIRLAMGTLSSLGTCLESKWSYDVAKVFTRPSWGAYREAFANKIDKFYRIVETGESRIQAIRTALAAQHPVVFGMMIDDDYVLNVKSDGIVQMPKAARPGLGGHAQLIVGIDDNAKRLIVRNSWGPFWGDGGYAYVPFEYLNVSNANDFWVATATPVNF